MSPTTSAKFVKLFIRSSHFSQQVNASMLVLACCFMVTSPLPIVVAAYLMVKMIGYAYQESFLAPTLSGSVTFFSTGEVEINQHRSELTGRLLILSAWVLAIRLDKRWYLIWRDSVVPEYYWHLVLLLKKEP
ncbi:hypothetical protein [Vibrio panuliri]|nr:hypothetical protein [Vibrio panuliri]